MSDCLAYNHSVSFINKPWTFISAIKLKKDFTKVSRVGPLFDLNFHCNIGQFTQLLNFWLSFRLVLLWKWNNNYSETIQCKELLRKTAKTCKFTKKRYSKNELKHSTRFDHVTDDVVTLFWSCEQLSGRTLLSRKFTLPCDKKLTF